jgi:uncharacterized membrane protein YhfC
MRRRVTDILFLALHYIPNRPLAIISGLLYLAIPVICIFWARKNWARYMLTIMIGGVCYAIGLFMRLRESDIIWFYGIANRNGSSVWVEPG